MASEIEGQGSCLCGAVRLSIKATNNHVGACHCNMCRKWSGSSALSIESVSNVHFEGSENISVFSSSEWAERGFCKQCGTHLFYRLKNEGQYSIPVGLMDEPENWVFDQQIFIDEKPSFYSFANETKNMTAAEVFALYSDPAEQ
ncbi:MAG: GFA family protein [Leptolyngbya sp. SIO1D8]|nr:GFA family protein [Leptolyngbya sp. SIO1D8]